MPAFYRRSFSEFLSDGDDAIVGRLTSAAAAAGFFQQHHAQTESWGEQIRLAKAAVRDLLSNGGNTLWQLLIEYPIPRRGRRIDAVLLAGSVIIVMEFKCGGQDYPHDAIAQVEDYCLDLRDFHKQSSGRTIVPVLISTNAPPRLPPAGRTEDAVQETWCTNSLGLSNLLDECIRRFNSTAVDSIDPVAWDESDYSPTPTVVEAAQSLYAGQNVRDITRCSGGPENLTRTTDAVIQLVEDARKQGKKRICFVTGVPGAGKTLAGLNIVHNHKLHDGDLGVFLSGNGPLVAVLTEALARDASERLEQSRSDSRRRVQTFIQNVHRFIDAYYADPTKVPVDKVVVFDEAQRAWDAEQSNRKFNRPFSEPEILLEVMNRHTDWAVIVALVGGGQEINRGEAGLAEWGRALIKKFPHWEVSVSPELKVGIHATGPCLFDHAPTGVTISEDESLHLRVNLRSYKSEQLSSFVDAVLRPDRTAARQLSSQLGEFPLVMTRDVNRARRWLREHCRGQRRSGLVASSGARRLRAHGLDVTAELDVTNWFLNGPNDVRSSHYLEVPATEFGVQGLELDWTGVCWGGDLSPVTGGWAYRAFRGTRWQQVRTDRERRYIVNKYRVLLTRAREGMVIWVPPGDEADPTRPPTLYNTVAAHLQACGIPSLP